MGMSPEVTARAFRREAERIMAHPMLRRDFGSVEEAETSLRAEAARRDERRRPVAGRPGGAAAPGPDARGPDGLLLSMAGFQSQFMGIEQQWKRIQTTAANGTPLEEEMRRIAGESLEMLSSIEAHTRPAGAPAPAPAVRA